LQLRGRLIHSLIGDPASPLAVSPIDTIPTFLLIVRSTADLFSNLGCLVLLIRWLSGRIDI
jgi:hypothetical protein